MGEQQNDDIGGVERIARTRDEQKAEQQRKSKAKRRKANKHRREARKKRAL